MEINEIKNPLFLKDLSREELKELCSRIREYIIEYTSVNGGYLSGNLSAVEIAVMLNRCFTAEDRLLFDGNDLNYTHKLLNGMADELKTNSNGAYSLANALGLSVSRDLDHKDHHVVAVVNSTDLLSGRNVEALNQISDYGGRLIIVFNDDTSINRGLGILDRLIANLRKTKSYNSLKDNVKDFIRPSKNGEKIIEDIHNFKTSLKKTVIDEGIFSEFNIDYIGPIDGKNLDDLERAISIAKQKEYPSVIHCLTSKGEGYKFAEASTDDTFDHVGPFDIGNGRQYGGETLDCLYPRHIAANTMHALMAQNSDLVCVTGRSINQYGAAALFAKYPERCFGGASSAENSLSFASGLALDGKIAFIPMKSFELTNSFRILKNQICKLDRPMIIGLEDNGLLNYRLLADLNNIYIYEPKDAQDLQNAFYTGTKVERPLILIYPEKCFRYAENARFEELTLGKWPVYANNEMRDVAIIASGLDYVNLKKLIVSNDLPYELIDASSIKPFDEEVLESLCSSKKEVYAVSARLKNQILEYLNDHGYLKQIRFLKAEDEKEVLQEIEEYRNA